MVAKAKVLGFIGGAALAAAGLTAFNIWRHVSDDDRLETSLKDHCLPYVRSEISPFDNMGRPPGVYDNVELREGVEGGGAKLLYDARFIAQWGETSNAGTSGDTAFRICNIQPTYAENTVAGFEVAADGFVDRYSRIIAPNGDLLPEGDALTAGPRTFGWFNANGDQSDGVRVVMVGGLGFVLSVLVATDIGPE